MTDVISIKYTGQNDPFYYIRLGALLQYFQDHLLYWVQIDDTNGSPLLKFDTEVESNLMFIEGLQISVDPNVCVINRTLTIDGEDYNFIPEDQKAESFDSPLFSKGYGQIMNIYVHMKWILLKLDELKDTKTNKVVLIDFLNNLLSSISSVLGGTNALEATVDENTNTVVIRDTNPIPNVEDVVIPTLNKQFNKNISNKYVLFDLYGYKKTGNTSHASFIKDFNFTTEISPQLSNMLTVGATANSTVVGENSTAFSRFNTGLTDRFKKEIKSTKDEIRKKLEDIQNDEKVIWEKYYNTFNNYIQYLKNLSNTGKNTFNNGEGDTYKDAVTNYTTYYQQFRQAVYDEVELKTGRKATPPPFLPGTGFIPFNMSLTMDGLSGMKIYNKFYIDTEYLPTNYPDNAEFLIKNISHKIENNKWYTNLESIITVKGKYDDKSKTILKTGGTTSTSNQSGPSEPEDKRPLPNWDKYNVGGTPILRSAIEQQSSYVYSKGSYSNSRGLKTPKGYGETVGYCAGYSYNIAYGVKSYITTQKGGAAIKTSYQNSGNANDQSHRNVINSLGIYDMYYLGAYKASELKNGFIKNLKWNYGDILNYFAPGFSPPHNMHTQIYTGGIWKSGINFTGKADGAGGSDWSTSAATNYGTQFVYSASDIVFRVFAFKIKPEYLK